MGVLRRSPLGTCQRSERHLEADPGETQNVQADYPEVVEELAGLLEAYQRIGQAEGSLPD